MAKSEIIAPGVEALALLNTKQAARYLSVSPTTVQRLVDARELPVVRVSPGRVGYRLADLDKFVEARVSPAVSS